MFTEGDFNIHRIEATILGAYTNINQDLIKRNESLNTRLDNLCQEFKDITGKKITEFDWGLRTSSFSVFSNKLSLTQYENSTQEKYKELNVKKFTELKDKFVQLRDDYFNAMQNNQFKI